MSPRRDQSHICLRALYCALFIIGIVYLQKQLFPQFCCFYKVHPKIASCKLYSNFTHLYFLKYHQNETDGYIAMVVLMICLVSNENVKYSFLTVGILPLLFPSFISNTSNPERWQGPAFNMSLHICVTVDDMINSTNIYHEPALGNRIPG